MSTPYLAGVGSWTSNVWVHSAAYDATVPYEIGLQYDLSGSTLTPKPVKYSFMKGMTICETQVSDTMISLNGIVSQKDVCAVGKIVGRQLTASFGNPSVPLSDTYSDSHALIVDGPAVISGTVDCLSTMRTCNLAVASVGPYKTYAAPIHATYVTATSTALFNTTPALLPANGQTGTLQLDYAAGSTGTVTYSGATCNLSSAGGSLRFGGVTSASPTTFYGGAAGCTWCNVVPWWAADYVAYNNTSVLLHSGNINAYAPAQVQSDWNATAGLGVVLNKPTIPSAQVQSDWNATTGLGVVLNKPTIISSTTILTCPGLSAQFSLIGGGVVSWSGTYLLWSMKVSAIPLNSSYASNGFLDILCPTSGTITYYNGSISTTLICTSQGIPLPVGSVLYYVINPGQASTFVQSQLVCAAYPLTTITPTSDWILIAVYNPLIGSVLVTPTSSMIVTNSLMVLPNIFPVKWVASGTHIAAGLTFDCSKLTIGLNGATGAQGAQGAQGFFFVWGDGLGGGGWLDFDFSVSPSLRVGSRGSAGCQILPPRWRRSVR